jgi:hypothetical protein
MGIEEKFRSKVEADKVRREFPPVHDIKKTEDSRKNREMSEHEKSRNESSKHMTREFKWYALSCLNRAHEQGSRHRYKGDKLLLSSDGRNLVIHPSIIEIFGRKFIHHIGWMDFSKEKCKILTKIQ